MYQKHPEFQVPANKNTKIWRYLSFTKLFSLVATKTLFFSRAVTLADTFEGSYSKSSFESWPVSNIPEEKQKEYALIHKHSRELTYINSWHMSEYESEAMWKLFSKNEEEGIALQSTLKRLNECFTNYPEDVYIGQVDYIDYQSHHIPGDKLFRPFLHKRKSFEHEKEVRAIISKFSKEGKKQKRVYDSGVYVPIALDVLIEKVYISPISSKWFHDLVHSVLDKYKTPKKVVQSNLNEGPIY